MKGKHTVNIPGELASVASNGIVASADGVYDYTKGKFQEDINNETEGRLTGQDAKLTKKLAEIDQKYDEFEDKTDEYFKQESAKNSQKIDDAVKEIAKIPNNEVKVVDQLPDTGVANTIYRVIGDTSYAEWAYTDGQWKKLAENNFGVDDEPTAGSEKLVKSGGVNKYLHDNYNNKDYSTNISKFFNKLCEEKKGIVGESYTRGHFVVSVSLYNTDKVTGFVNVKHNPTSEFLYVFTLDINYKVIRKIEFEEFNNNGITINEGEDYLVVNSPTEDSYIILHYFNGNKPILVLLNDYDKIQKLQDSIDILLPSIFDILRIDADMDKKADISFGKNLFNKDSDKILYDKLLNKDGNVYSADFSKNFNVSPYIKIKPNTHYISNYTSTDQAIVLNIYDSELNVIESFNNVLYEFDSPENAAYIRFAYRATLGEQLIINEGTKVIDGAVYSYPYLTEESVKKLFSNLSGNYWNGKTLALYGDSITELCGNDKVNESSWAGYLKRELNCDIIVRGWGGTSVTHSVWDNENTGVNHWWFNKNGEKVTVGTEGGIICNPVGMCDWKRIITQFPEPIKDSIYAVVLMGGTNDFKTIKEGTTNFIEDSISTPLDTDWKDSKYYCGGDFDTLTIKGAICSAIMKLQAWMPQAIIIIATPLSGRATSEDFNGKNTTGLCTNDSGVSEAGFSQFIKDAARYMSTPVIDIFGETGINPFNRKYFIYDRVHPYQINDKDNVSHNNGNVAMARVFITNMRSIMPKFDYKSFKE